MKPPESIVGQCTRCGNVLPPGAADCAACGQFVHIDRLNALTREAVAMEPHNPWMAAGIWQQALQLLPRNAPQALALQNRIAILSAGHAPVGTMFDSSGQAVGYNPRLKAEPSLAVTWLKVFGSMLLSIAVYAWYFESAAIATGFCILMLIHEMGHVLANRYYGIKASPPIFVPFLGAVINLKQSPPNAKVEAIIGIAGPIAGTIGALICYAYYLQTNSELALGLSYVGFMLNLFNLLPVPPLDGGRVTAAVSPWIWMLGLAGLAWLFITDLQRGHTDYILILVLVYAFPRIRATLHGRARHGDYYKVSRAATWSIGTLYIVLGVSLLYLFHHVSGMLA